MSAPSVLTLLSVHVPAPQGVLSALTTRQRNFAFGVPTDSTPSIPVFS
jgi:hypothetical protein